MEALDSITLEDFIDGIYASMRTEHIKQMTSALPASGQVIRETCLAVMNWASIEVRDSGNRLFIYYRHVANWVMMRHTDNLHTQEQKTKLEAMKIEEIITLIWHCTNEARQDENQVKAYMDKTLV